MTDLRKRQILCSIYAMTVFDDFGVFKLNHQATSVGIPLNPRTAPHFLKQIVKNMDWRISLLLTSRDVPSKGKHIIMNHAQGHSAPMLQNTS